MSYDDPPPADETEYCLGQGCWSAAGPSGYCPECEPATIDEESVDAPLHDYRPAPTRQARPRQQVTRDSGSFWTFDKMVSPTIIQVIFWIGIGLIVLSALGQFIMALDNRYGGGEQMVVAVGTLLIGPLVWRVYCELMIVIFRIHTTLRGVNDRLDTLMRDRTSG